MKHSSDVGLDCFDDGNWPVLSVYFMSSTYNYTFL